MIRAVSAIVHGNVQGVGFRFRTRHEARSYGVTGWVCNRPDGTVEAWLEGERSAVSTVLTWLSSPGFTFVSAVDVTDRQPTGYAGFEIG